MRAVETDLHTREKYVSSLRNIMLQGVGLPQHQSLAEGLPSVVLRTDKEIVRLKRLKNSREQIHKSTGVHDAIHYLETLIADTKQSLRDRGFLELHQRSVNRADLFKKEGTFKAANAKLKQRKAANKKARLELEVEEDALREKRKQLNRELEAIDDEELEVEYSRDANLAQVEDVAAMEDAILALMK